MQGVGILGLMACRYCFFVSLDDGPWALHVETLNGGRCTEDMHPVVRSSALISLFFRSSGLVPGTCGLAINLPIGCLDLIYRQ